MKLSHAETQALISARLDGPLDPVAERELNAHLATCDSCRAFNASAGQLARGLQSLPYLPASPAVARAVLDHVSTPRSPLSWLAGSFPANALPAASAIAAAVIVVFVGSFAAFRFLDADDEPSMIPASTRSVNDLAQSSNETAEATLGSTETVETVSAPTDAVEGQAVVTEEPTPATEVPVGTDPAEESGEPATEVVAIDEVTG
ncbi:MAG: zf-HC2 domain-containing protein, partial [Chloroflexota bacterium]|nr:zf-HC2 domain-containing protein [Chloroflexota bacterium]